ncbi:Ku protein [Streptomyces sp. NPDC046557]|uniref:Ku protein n=1 Tax=Streptomyces sp. NPDC046557 TaxID=3155372 RepID=UPI0033DD2D34
MARPVWAGNLSFGLVSLPVGLYTATDSHTIRFHQLQRGTSDRIRNRRVNERTGDEVELTDIVKGYDTGDEYVLVESKELDDIAPGLSQSLDIAGFVDLTEVDPIFFDKAKASDKELKMAEQLIRAVSMDWEPEEFHDTFREKVTALIEAKKAGGTVEKAEPAAEPTGVVDLMEALRASVERAGSPKTAGGKATVSERTAAGKKPAAKKRIRSAPKEDLSGLPKADLYKKAAAANVPGRSHMTRDDLVKALSRT